MWEGRCRKREVRSTEREMLDGKSKIVRREMSYQVVMEIGDDDWAAATEIGIVSPMFVKVSTL